MSLLDVNVIREQGKFLKNVYRKPSFNRVYTHFDCFLPSNYETGVTKALVNRCFPICSN